MTKYLEFWGKAQPSQEISPSWHPAAYHCLDVAAVAQELQLERRNEVERISAAIGIASNDFIRLNVFFIALHDIGKFSRAFQALAPEHWPQEVLGEFQQSPYGSHWQISHEILTATLRDNLLDLLKLSPNDDVEPLVRSVAGHHGIPPSNDADIDEQQLCSASLAAAKAFLLDIHALLLPPKYSWLEDEKHQKKLSYWLAGLTVAADWLGSNTEFFEYTVPELSLAEYWTQKALPRAKQAVEKAGLISASPTPDTDLDRLFGIDTPRPMQEAMAILPLPDGPMLVIIEDATGSGKTEAAILLAQRMMAAGKAGGLYFALPTMATANAMFTRMGKSYRHLFVDHARPSLALAHGRRNLDKKWYSSLKLPEQMTASLKGPDEETAAQCAAWIADDRRKTFFAQIGVGTIDQALLAVLPSKFQSLRLWGLSDRILIIDEAHAYDAYMSKELETLLQFHASNGGSVLILSATLPGEKRAQLIKAFHQGLGKKEEIKAETKEAKYPLVTIAGRGPVHEINNIDPAKHTERTVHVERLADRNVAIERIARAANNGAAVAFIRNAVDDAIEAVECLRSKGINADLFHARYAMGDRQKIETKAVSRFGKEDDLKERKGRVLVATQVVEQSLDLDFDLMVSDLAPVDLLIQRAGRLWRHMDKRPEKQRPVEGPKLLVLSPDPGKVEDDKWLHQMGHKGAYVYPNHALLWRTAKSLFDKGGFTAPDDLRNLIEYVYGDPPAQDTPKDLRDFDGEAEGNHWGDRSNASFNLLSLNDGYSKAGSWLEEDAVRTRLGEPTKTIRLACIDGDRLVPLCKNDNNKPCWPLSEISIACKWLDGAETASSWRTAANAASKDWPKWQQTKILIAPVDNTGTLLLDKLKTPLTYGPNGLERLKPNQR